MGDDLLGDSSLAFTGVKTFSIIGSGSFSICIGSMKGGSSDYSGDDSIGYGLHMIGST